MLSAFSYARIYMRNYFAFVCLLLCIFLLLLLFYSFAPESACKIHSICSCRLAGSYFNKRNQFTQAVCLLKSCFTCIYITRINMCVCQHSSTASNLKMQVLLHMYAKCWFLINFMLCFSRPHLTVTLKTELVLKK